VHLKLLTNFFYCINRRKRIVFSTFILLIIFSFFTYNASSQVVNTGFNDTTNVAALGKWSINFYIDTYYGINFRGSNSKPIPYMVSMNQNRQFNINIGTVDIRFQSKNFRARFMPGVGSYMNANYANEKGIGRNIVEASAGILLSKKHNAWLDVGVLGSPYTNESAISKDQLIYTRSFGPEYAPYYLTGAKLSVPINKKINAYLYLISGWQKITIPSNGTAIGTQVEYRPNNKMLLNWNTYFGNEYSIDNPNYGNRYFTDLYLIYTVNKKLSLSSCLYAGIQERYNAANDKKSIGWGQINFIGKYNISNSFSISGRIERFIDPQSIMILPTTGIKGFNTSSVALCTNYAINKHFLWRTEFRMFSSKNLVFEDQNGIIVNKMNWGITSLAISF